MIQTSSRRKRRPLLTCSVRKLALILSMLLFIYLRFLWTTISSHVKEHQERKSNIDGSSTSVSQQQTVDIKNSKVAPITIGIASTVTGCGTDPFWEGAAVLKYSIELTSFTGPKGGKYEYKFYVMHHPDAIECVLPLQDLGFTLLERPTPVNVSDIQGDILRERIVNNGCCGEKELIKLEAYRLIEHPIIIHMDLDVLVLKPMDAVIGFMLDPKQAALANFTGVPIMWPTLPVPDDIQLIFTKDYNVVAPRRYAKPYQGGFFMLKPSLETYQEFVDIVLQGDYVDEDRRKGWGGKVGPFHGGMTIQGLLPWYYQYLHPDRTVELNRCIYNSIADNPTIEKTVEDVAQGRCRTNEEVCEDCRARPMDEIVTFHYTACQKPWMCVPQKQDRIQMRLCHRAHHEWHVYRRNLEISWGRQGTGIEKKYGDNGTYYADHFLGHCHKFGLAGYQPIRLPYGTP